MLPHYYNLRSDDRVGFIHALVVVKKQSLAPPGFRIARVLLDDVVHHPQRGIVLPFLILLEGLVDLHMDRLTAPLELFAAAART